MHAIYQSSMASCLAIVDKLFIVELLTIFDSFEQAQSIIQIPPCRNEG